MAGFDLDTLPPATTEVERQQVVALDLIDTALGERASAALKELSAIKTALRTAAHFAGPFDSYTNPHRATLDAITVAIKQAESMISGLESYRPLISNIASAIYREASDRSKEAVNG